MQDENKKETLTRDIIKKELVGIYIHNLLIRSWCIPLFVFLAWAFAWIISDHIALKDNYANTGIAILAIQYGIATILLIISASLIIITFYKFISLIIFVSKDKFDVVIKKLVDKDKGGRHKYSVTEYSIDEMELHDHRKPYVFLIPELEIHNSDKAYVINKLHFAKCKPYYIPEGKLYRWSNKYSMEHWAVYRWAEIGDEFYLVTAKNKILYVYNTKHFELKD